LRIETDDARPDLHVAMKSPTRIRVCQMGRDTSKIVLSADEAIEVANALVDLAERLL
jgi:hypothetical protein